MKFETSAELGAAVQDQTAAFRLISDILKIVSLLVAAITIFIVTYIDLVNKPPPDRNRARDRHPVSADRRQLRASKPVAYAIAGIGARLPAVQAPP